MKTDSNGMSKSMQSKPTRYMEDRGLKAQQ